MLPPKPDAPARTEIEPSPLDRPLNRTYLGVIAVEAIVIVLLIIVGRMFS